MPADAQHSPSTLPVLDIPFVFSQVPLLSSGQFRNEARSKWDQRISIDDLEQLHRLGLLVPLYRADDDREAEPLPAPHEDDSSKIARYAREGLIRDPQGEDASLWPHRRSDAGDTWWDGFFYSQWQLLGLRDALRERENLRVIAEDPRIAGEEDEQYQAFAARQRHEHLALAALSARFFPSIIGRVTYRDGAERETLLAARYDVDAAARLVAASFPVERLRSAAEFLLSRAHTYDPMREWWDLARHSDASGWFRLRGGALEAVGNESPQKFSCAHTKSSRRWGPLTHFLRRATRPCRSGSDCSRIATAFIEASRGLACRPNHPSCLCLKGRPRWFTYLRCWMPSVSASPSKCGSSTNAHRATGQPTRSLRRATVGSSTR